MKVLFSAGVAVVLAVAPSLAYSQTAASKSGRGSPTFFRDVLPILQQHCQSCHRPGGIAPMSLVSYKETKLFAYAIADDTRDRKMPPWFADPKVGHFSNDPSLSAGEIQTLAAWAAANAPAGRPEDAPPARQFARGWNIPRPDVVVRMPKPVVIPAQGDVEYTYEIVPTGFTEGKWVRMSESARRAAGTSTTPWSTSVRRIRRGCGTRRKTCPSRRRT